MKNSNVVITVRCNKCDHITTTQHDVNQCGNCRSFDVVNVLGQSTINPIEILRQQRNMLENLFLK